MYETDLYARVHGLLERRGGSYEFITPIPLDDEASIKKVWISGGKVMMTTQGKESHHKLFDEETCGSVDKMFDVLYSLIKKL